MEPPRIVPGRLTLGEATKSWRAGSRKITVSRFRKFQHMAPDFVRDRNGGNHFVIRQRLLPSVAHQVDGVLGGGNQVVISSDWHPQQSTHAAAGHRSVDEGYGDLHNWRNNPEAAREVAVAMNVANGYLDKEHVAACSSVRSTTRGAKMKPGGADINEHVAGLVCVRGDLAKYAIKVLADAMSKVKQDRQRLVVLTAKARQPAADEATQRALERHRKTSLLLPLRSILPRYVRTLEQDRARSAASNGRRTKKTNGRGDSPGYRGTKLQWSSRSNDAQFASIQHSNVIRLDRALLQSACVEIPGLGLLCAITESQFREEILCVELTLHDSSGELLSSFWWHRDDTPAEAGSIEDARSMKRTIIWAFDRGHVNLEIAGFEPIIYDEVFFFM
jgi:hypothetical protein